MSDPLSATEAVTPPAADRYASLLTEARSLKGVSLYQDAWRRLRKNWAAMISLLFLLVIVLLALLTPLIPLQSPIAIRLHVEADGTRWAYRGPNLQPVEMNLVEELAAYDKQVDALRAKQPENLEDQIAALPSPFKNWHEPGVVTGGLIRARIAMFGNWCIPSICGCDKLGRDLLSRICWGARVSLMVGVIATLVSLLIGVTYGATAGFVGGWVDNAMMRVVDVMYSVPFIFVVIFIITILKDDSIKAAIEGYGIDRIAIFFVLIGAIYWLTMARVVRGQVISLKNEQFVEAARTIGAGNARIVFRHLIPNVMGVVIVYLTLTIPAVMLFEAFLSFLGLGVEAPDVSWGLLVNEGVKVITPIRIFWWMVLFPGLTLTLTLYSLTFLGDGMRDALDPRLKNRE